MWSSGKPLSTKLEPFAVRQYATAHSWVLKPFPNERFWLLSHPNFPLRQLQIPMDKASPGFADAMDDVVRRLAELEGREPETVLEDLFAADADVLRFRVAHPSTDSGQLPLALDVALRDAGRRALLSAAISVLNPSRHHPRLSRGDANTLLAACRAGQTEVGSYVFKIVCPLSAVEATSGEAPFTRKATSLLMRSTHALIESIETGKTDEFLAQDAENPTLSSNLCDALVQMHPDRDAGEVELTSSWGSHPVAPLPHGVPSKVVIKAAYVPVIESIAAELRPNEQAAKSQSFVGTVEALNGELEDDGRRSGEVTLAVLLGDGERITARATLNADDYAQAMQAHQNSSTRFVALRGQLRYRPRVSTIEQLESFRVVRDENEDESR